MVRSEFFPVACGAMAASTARLRLRRAALAAPTTSSLYDYAGVPPMRKTRAADAPEKARAMKRRTRAKNLLSRERCTPAFLLATAARPAPRLFTRLV